MNAGKVVFEVELGTKNYDAQMKKVESDFNDIQKQINELSKGPKTNSTKQSLIELSSELEKTANKYVDLKNKQEALYTSMRAKEAKIYKQEQEQLKASIKNINMMSNATYSGKNYSLQYESLGNSISKIKGDLPYVADGFKDISKEAKDAGDKVEDTGKKSQKSGNDMSKGFSKGLKSVKKLALGIVGIRSAYMLARRAASAYMAQDEDLAKSMQSVWTGLGAFLAPLLEMITNLMLKFVGYLNVFIKALTHKDLIAAANAKILEKQAKAQEKLNKATKEYQNYDFDVIRTQQTDKSSGNGSVDEANLIQIPELNQGIVKKLQDLAKWLKKNKDLIEKVGIALGVTFGAVAIGKLLANIGALLGSSTLMTGLLGLAAILSILAIGYTIKVWIDGKKEIDEMWQKVHDLNEWNQKKRNKIVNDIFGQDPQSTDPKDIQRVKSAQGFYMGDYTRQVDEAYDHWQSVKNKMFGWSGVFGFDEGAEQNYYDTINNMKQVTSELITFAEKGELTNNGYRNLIIFATKYGDKLDDLNTLTKKYNIDQDKLYEAIREYSGIYPEVLAEILGFNELSEEQQKQVEKLNDDFKSNKINLQEYLSALNKIPLKKSTKVETPGIVDAGKNVANYIANAINKIPNEKTTKLNVDDKDAETKTTNYKNNLLNLPNTVLTTIKATLDTSAADWQMQQFKQKISNFPIVGSMFSKLFSVMGFAGGGYISQPTLAMVGEGKYNEYVIPEGEDYISRLANEIGKYGSGGGVTNVYLDGRLIQRQVSKTANQVSFTRNGR